MSTNSSIDFLTRLSEEHFLLHGSVHACDVLEPRQAFGYSEKHGQNLCAVYATQVLEIALMKSTIIGVPGEWGWKFDFGLFSWRRTARINVYGEVQRSSGFIYVLDKNNFETIAPFTSVSYKPVVPLARVEVFPHMLDQLGSIRFKGEFPT